MIIHPRLEMIGWNRRVLTYADFEHACEEEDITLIIRYLPHDWGTYERIGDDDVITLTTDMTDPFRTFVAFHELGHALLHVPGHFGMIAKSEAQADVVGLCALLPRPLIQGCSLYDIAERYEKYSLDWIRERFEIARTTPW